MLWEPWPRIETSGLARYIGAEIAKSVPIPPLHLDLAPSSANRLKVIQGLYEYLLSVQLQYALEEYHPSSVLQNIRTPAEILAEKQGTCLDLATLFCGLCLRCELLPFIIVLEGHALAAISLSYGLRDWNQQRPGRALFDSGPLTDPAPLQEMLADTSLLAVECTGFARSLQMQEHPQAACPETIGRVSGLMDFTRATKAGQEQLSARAFHFAVDIAVAHYGWRISPLPPVPLYSAFGATVGEVKSHILVRQLSATIKDKTENFVGRRKLIQAIDARLRDSQNPSGYIIVKGEPGSGKTALMANLVRQRGYVHHFNIFNQNIRTTRQFLENICAQIILRYDLNRPMLPNGVADSSGPLVELLAEASEKNQGNAIVVVVDALDESASDPSEGVNRLLLPGSLPENVFFLVSTRLKVNYQLVVSHRDDLAFDDIQFKDEIAGDIQLYIEQFVERNSETMQKALAAWHVDTPSFVTCLSGRAKGNFMYLVNVLKDIRDGKMSKDNIDSIDHLPQNLAEYYARHWRMMQDLDPARFKDFYEPVVCILAAVREPIELGYLTELTKLPTPRVKEVLNEWRQFLRVDPMPAGPPVHSLYHYSFREFLLEEVGIDRFKDMIRNNAISKVPGL